jgi:dTDP-4-amino-4,6-dideoxygalactose transaminase
MVLTRDDALAARVRQDRHQGQRTPYVHDSLGACSRLDEVQAAALAVKLAWLDRWNDARRAHAGRYTTLLTRAGLAGADGPLALPPPAGAAHVFHQYVVRARDRDRLRAHLARADIGTQVYYPVPLHRQPALADLDVPAGALPIAERAASEVLALPIYPELTPAQIDTVVETIGAFYR